MYTLLFQKQKVMRMKSIFVVNIDCLYLHIESCSFSVLICFLLIHYSTLQVHSSENKNFGFVWKNVDVVVAPPFVYIEQVKSSLTSRIEISAQNSWVSKGGAFTGEIRLSDYDFSLMRLFNF